MTTSDVIEMEAYTYLCLELVFSGRLLRMAMRAFFSFTLFGHAFTISTTVIKSTYGN